MNNGSRHHLPLEVYTCSWRDGLRSTPIGANMPENSQGRHAIAPLFLDDRSSLILAKDGGEVGSGIEGSIRGARDQSEEAVFKGSPRIFLAVTTSGEGQGAGRVALTSRLMHRHCPPETRQIPRCRPVQLRPPNRYTTKPVEAKFAGTDLPRLPRAEPVRSFLETYHKNQYHNYSTCPPDERPSLRGYHSTR